MKPESRLLRKTTRHTLMAAVFLFCFSSLSGCITHKVLDLRQERETRVKEAVNFWSLAAVRSAHVVAGSDAFACVEFRDSPADAPQAYTINLSQASRIGRTFPEVMPSDYGRTGLAWHFYPLQGAQTGCGNATAAGPLPASALKIDTVRIRREGQPQLPEIHFSSADGKADAGRLIEVSFASEGHQVEPLGAKDVLLVYLPPAKDGELIQPIGVAGAFETSSEWVNPYTLLVAPAVAADTFVLWIISGAGGDPSRYIDRR